MGVMDMTMQTVHDILRAVAVHLGYTVVSVSVGFVLGVALGIVLSRFPRGSPFYPARPVRAEHRARHRLYRPAVSVAGDAARHRAGCAQHLRLPSPC